eukprot:Selendium_serpulae@DN5037_c0_g1_i1.p1
MGDLITANCELMSDEIDGLFEEDDNLLTASSRQTDPSFLSDRLTDRGGAQPHRSADIGLSQCCSANSTPPNGKADRRSAGRPSGPMASPGHRPLASPTDLKATANGEARLTADTGMTEITEAG